MKNYQLQVNNHPMNHIGLYTIYRKEMQRAFAIPLQTFFSPVITTVLYFIVFGAAIGSQIPEINDITYMQFIVPGLIMMALLTNSLSASSSGIYFPKFIGTIYEILSAPLSYLEIILGYTLSATSRALIIGILIYTTALFFTPIPIAHPIYALFFAFLTAFTFALFGLIIGIWSDTFEKLSLFPTLIIMPLAFLGGIFYPVTVLPSPWQEISLINPVVYMISGLRWSFFGHADIAPQISLALIIFFLFVCITALYFIFTTGYKIRD